MNPALGLMGLACRAGQMTFGADMTLQEIRGGRAGLVLLDEGASAGTKKKISDACAYRQVPLHILPEGDLGNSCGKSAIMAVAVKPGKLCARLKELLS